MVLKSKRIGYTRAVVAVLTALLLVFSFAPGTVFAGEGHGTEPSAGADGSGTEFSAGDEGSGTEFSAGDEGSGGMAEAVSEGEGIGDGTAPPQPDEQPAKEPTPPIAGEENDGGTVSPLAASDEYYAGDVAVINSIIENNGLPWEKADPADGSYVPDDWEYRDSYSPCEYVGVSWSDEPVGKRIVKLSVEVNGYGDAPGSSNGLTGELDVSALSALEELGCSYSGISSINVSGLTALRILGCEGNNLASLDLSGLSGLTDAYCGANGLTSLTTTGCTALTDLDCHFNLLSGLDLSECNALITLYCAYNRLEWLAVPPLASMYRIECSYNQLAELDISPLSDLLELGCRNNLLTGLDVTGFGNLQYINCSNNFLADEDAVVGIEGVTEFTGWDFEWVENDDELEVYAFAFYPQKESSESFTLTVVGGEGASGSGSYAPYTIVGITAGTPPDGKQFGKWTSNGGMFFNYTNATTEFIMPPSNVTLTAQFVDIPPPSHADPGFYNPGDIAAINHMIDNNNLKWEKAIPADGSYVPTDWNRRVIEFYDSDDEEETESEYPEYKEVGVLWSDDETDKRIVGLSVGWYPDTSLTKLTGTLDVSGLPRLKELNCERNSISSLNVSGLAALEELVCGGNQLSALDVSSLAALKKLDCSKNRLTALGLSGLAALEDLDCSKNRLSALGLSGLDALKRLDCSWNDSLASLDVTVAAALETLDCSRDYLLGALDLAGLSKLKELYCVEIGIASLDLSGVPLLEALDCGGNEELLSLDLSRVPALKWLACDWDGIASLDLSNLPALEYLSVMGLPLASLDVSGFSSLKTLKCCNGELAFLDVAGTALEYLDCSDNRLATLDLYGLPALKTLYCEYNSLATLNLIGLAALETLDCNDNLLTALDVADCTKLKLMNCTHNNMADDSAVAGIGNVAAFKGWTAFGYFRFPPQNDEIPQTWALTVEGGTDARGAGSYTEGAAAYIYAGTPPIGLQFAYWASGDGVVFGNANSAGTSFIMPAKPVTVTAHFYAQGTGYNATLSPTSKTFANAEPAYASAPRQQFTVTNTGTGTISGLAAALGNGAASSFAIADALSATALAPGGAATVSVEPNAGLAAGTYTDMLLIAGNGGVSLSAFLSFTVNAPVYTATVSPTNKDFGEAGESYSELPGQEFTVRNTGTGSLSGLSAALGRGAGSQFEIIGPLAAALGPNQSAAVSVRPKTGLSPGRYSDTLSVTGAYGINISVPLAFSVKEKPQDRNVVKGIDTFCFTNSSSDFFSGATGTYKITGDYFAALLQAAETPTGRAYVISIMDSQWGGSCFGMSSVLALAKAGDLSPGFFQSGATKLYDLARPRNSETISNLVNYYQLMQLTPTTQQARYTYSDANKRIVDAMKGSVYPVMICFNLPGGGGHAIIGYDITENPSNFAIKIWDPNSLDSPSNTLYITKDYTNAWFDGNTYLNFYYNPPSLKYALPVEGKSYDFLNIQAYLSGKKNPAGASGSGETAIVTNFRDFRIAASNGESAVIANGAKISGDLGISGGDPLFEEKDMGYLRFVVPTLPAGAYYTVTPAGAAAGPDGYEASIFYDNKKDGFYSRALSDAGGDYTFGADGSVAADFGGAPHEATLELTRNDFADDLYTASVTATDTGLSLAPDPGSEATVAVAGFDGNVDGGTATVGLSGDYNSVVFDDIPAESGFSITEDDGTVELLDANEDPVVDGEAVGYSVSFITNGGTAYEARSNIPEGQAIKSPGTPKKAGHAFGGWYSDEAFAQPWDFNTPITGNMALYAKWTANRYAVTYNANGGKFAAGLYAGEKTVKRAETFGDDYASGLGEPERAGYSFLGWNTAKDTKKGVWVYMAGEQPVVSKMMIDKNHTVYAIWEPKAGAVFLNYNNGQSQDFLYKNVMAGKTVGTGGKLPKPTRDGYAFGGWYKKDAAGALKTKVTDSTKMAGTGSITLFAKWAPKKISVTMNLNQKSRNPSSSNTTKKVSVNYGSAYAALAIPALQGGRFVKWAYDAAGSQDAAGLIETGVDSKGAPRPVTVYAQYADNAENAYTVRLDPNGGNVSAASIPVTYNKNPQSKYSELAYYAKGAAGAPDRAGYVFTGWYTAKNGGSKVTAGTKVTKYVDHALYARWTANKYWIKFDVDDADSGYSAKAPAAKTYAYGSKYKSLPTPKRTGYTFSGWYFDAEDGGSVYDVQVSKNSIAGNVLDAGTTVVDLTQGLAGTVGGVNYKKKLNPGAAVLHAKWTPKTYKVTLDANGGTFGAGVKTAKVNGTYGAPYALPDQARPAALVPPKNKTDFLGWYTKKAGGVQAIGADGTVGAGALVKTAKAHTLYAHWG